MLKVIPKQPIADRKDTYGYGIMKIPDNKNTEYKLAKWLVSDIYGF